MTTTNLQKQFLASTSSVILKLENALNQRNSAGFVDLLDDSVSIDGKVHPKSKVVPLLEQSFKATPDLVVVNDVCDVSVQANKTYKRTRRGRGKAVYSTSSWTAACRQSRHQDGKVVASTTTYVFDPTSNLKSISDDKSAAAE